MRVVFAGFVFALLANISFYALVFGKDWPFFNGFSFSLFMVGISYMGTFFHEIGHTLFFWVYGYIAIPIFDFNHGGGLSLPLTEQQPFLVLLVWGAFGYWIWLLREERIAQIFIAVLIALNCAVTFSPYHMSMIIFMGPVAESLIAGFFLIRALLDLAPRGNVERFLNSFFGFGIIFQSFIEGYGLLKSSVFRLVYYEQKGAHGHGDFDKIANNLHGVSFEQIVFLWLTLNFLCFLLPFCYTYFIRYRSRCE